MRIIVGISGASGAILGYRLVELLKEYEEIETHLVVSAAGIKTLESETNHSYEDLCLLSDFVHDDRDMAASISSGSFETEGMIVAPCSMKTLSGIANAYDANLLVRSADVCLKERRKVVLLPREMPLDRAHLKNMLECQAAGCVIMPPVLTFYNHPKTIEEQVDHVVGKALMQFGIHVSSFKAWSGI